jgi:hypothetical protein
MKYLLLIYSNPVNWEHPMFLNQDEELTPAERQARLEEHNRLVEEIAASGELIDAAPLADPLITRTVRVRDGLPGVTDGPFLDSKEHLAGYFVLDCESPERAIEIAARFPDARYSAVEVRPIMDPSGFEM